MRRVMTRAAANIRDVHAAFRPVARETVTADGAVIGRRPDPLSRVGVYAPGGRAAYPSSVLMGAVPARVAGVGEVIVQIPWGMAARVHVNTGLGNVETPSGYTRQGDWYVAPGYDTAANRVELEINGGVGRIAVQEIGGR